MYPSTNQVQTPQQQPSLQNSPSQPKKNKTWLWIASSIVAVLLVGTIISLLLFKAGTSPTVHSSATTPTTSIPATSIPATSIPTVTAPTTLSALQILQDLKAKGLPIGDYFDYTAENDLNKQLGRPHQYTSKVNFKDTRITASPNQGANISVSDGGSLEVFATAADAQHRFDYLQALSSSGSALFAEYEYLDGTVVMRISSQLTPTQVAPYQTTLKMLP